VVAVSLKKKKKKQEKKRERKKKKNNLNLKKKKKKKREKEKEEKNYIERKGMPATEYADIKERVAVLEEVPLEDEQPNIEAGVGSVLFDPYSEYDWVDRNAYESRWNEEAAVIAQVVSRFFFSFLTFIHSKRRLDSFESSRRLVFVALFIKPHNNRIRF